MNESPEIHKHETARRQLGYTPSFKEFIHENPGIIKSLNNITSYFTNELVVHNGDVFQEGGLTATIVKTRIFEDKPFFYFKIDNGTQAFFVKSEGAPARGKGYEELLNTAKVRERIKDIPGVDVVDFELGYQDNKKGSYFVSEWKDLPRLDDYLIRSSRKEDLLIRFIYKTSRLDSIWRSGELAQS